MANKLNERYPGRTTPADPNYPYGSFKNESGLGANDGTPLEKAQGDDLEGFTQALLLAGGVVPSGNPDTLAESDRLNALLNVRGNIKGYATILEAQAGDNTGVDYIDIGERAGGRFERITVGQAGSYPDELKFLAGSQWWGIVKTIELPASWAGAKGDDSVDDYQALQACLDLGGRVKLTGVHYLTQSLQIKSSNTVIVASDTLKDGFSVDDSFVGDYVINYSNEDGVSALAECGMEGVKFINKGSGANCPRGIRYNFLIRNSFFRNLIFADWTRHTIYSDETIWSDRSENIDFYMINRRAVATGSEYKLIESPLAIRFTNESTFRFTRIFGGNKNDPANWINGFDHPLMIIDECQGVSVSSECFFAYHKGTTIHVKSTLAPSAQVQGIKIGSNSFENIIADDNTNTDTIIIEGTAGVGTVANTIEVSTNRYVSTTSPTVKVLNTVNCNVTDPNVNINFDTGVDKSLGFNSSLAGRTLVDSTGNNTWVQIEGSGIAFYRGSTTTGLVLQASTAIPNVKFKIDPSGNGLSVDTIRLLGRNESNIPKTTIDFGGVGQTFSMTPYGHTIGTWATTGTPTGQPEDTYLLSNTLLFNTVDNTLLFKKAGLWLTSAVFS